jgi:hypothetical protein
LNPGSSPEKTGRALRVSRHADSVIAQAYINPKDGCCA